MVRKLVTVCVGTGPIGSHQFNRVPRLGLELRGKTMIIYIYIYVPINMYYVEHRLIPNGDRSNTEDSTHSNSFNPHKYLARALVPVSVPVPAQ